MKIIADTHTHTIMSGHAHSTVLENVTEAKRKGLRFIAITDHTGKMPASPHETYFACMWSALPDEYEGVYILRGCEVNILDENGDLDLSDKNLARLEWRIASIHKIITTPMDFEKHTKLWLNIAKNPLIDVIGHSGEEDFKYDYERVIPEFKKHGKVVEINAYSAKARPTSIKNCTEIARLCAKYGVPLVLSSDAHFASAVGEVSEALEIVKVAGVPEELILNADAKRFSEFLEKKLNRKFPI